MNEAAPPRYLTVEDVATSLRVTVPTARALVRSGDISGFQVGGRGLWRVEPRSLSAYVARQKKAAKNSAERRTEVAPESRTLSRRDSGATSVGLTRRSVEMVGASCCA